MTEGKHQVGTIWIDILRFESMLTPLVICGLAYMTLLDNAQFSNAQPCPNGDCFGGGILFGFEIAFRFVFFAIVFIISLTPAIAALLKKDRFLLPAQATNTFILYFLGSGALASTTSDGVVFTPTNELWIGRIALAILVVTVVLAYLERDRRERESKGVQ